MNTTCDVKIFCNFFSWSLSLFFHSTWESKDISTPLKTQYTFIFYVVVFVWPGILTKSSHTWQIAALHTEEWWMLMVHVWVASTCRIIPTVYTAETRLNCMWSLPDAQVFICFALCSYTDDWLMNSSSLMSLNDFWVFL